MFMQYVKFYVVEWEYNFHIVSSKSTPWEIKLNSVGKLKSTDIKDFMQAVREFYSMPALEGLIINSKEVFGDTS